MTIDHYIETQKPEIQAILKPLRAMILKASPKMQEKLNYGVPFYYYHGRWFCYVCFIKSRKQVELSFINGQELSNEQGILEFYGRQSTASVVFRNREDVDKQREAVREILQEALIIGDLKKK